MQSTTMGVFCLSKTTVSLETDMLDGTAKNYLRITIKLLLKIFYTQIA